ncbi:MAG: two-component sensor histidine kinase [Deltaproteobacteria bacterium]|nr:two-component sensor histidine kinase [Deltaproteobacteria bacterium]
MARTSELIDFRRAFWWLLGGVLLPSIALVAFGVVAVANERAAAERRLADEYGGRLRTLETVLRARLDQAAETAGDKHEPDPLVRQTFPLDERAAEGLQIVDLAARAASLPLGQHLFATSDKEGDRRTFALVRTTAPSGEWTLAVELDLARLQPELTALAAANFPHERANFRVIAPPDRSTPLAVLRHALSEVAPSDTRSATVARLPLQAPLDGYLITAELAGDDPAGALAFRTRTLYIALLVLLYASIGVGFALTLRELYRAAQLSRLKTDFVANISHELRTPLTSVRMFAETLQTGRASSPEEVKECLDLLTAEAERLSTLVEKLLDWSRLESGSRVLRKETLEPSALFAHVGEVYRAQQLAATYKTELEPGLPAVEVDRDAISQVVLNLLHNAVKYTGPDKRISLRARRVGKRVAIEVEDNGSGVRAQDKKRIFERFYRADDLLTRRTEGTGLGLAIAKRIVEWHGGTIEVDSEPGRGSTFRVLLPAAT